MTERLAATLQAHRHLRGKRVLVRAGGDPFTMKIVQNHVARAAHMAAVRPGVHILRHYSALGIAGINSTPRCVANQHTMWEYGGNGIYRDHELLSVEPR